MMVVRLLLFPGSGRRRGSRRASDLATVFILLDRKTSMVASFYGTGVPARNCVAAPMSAPLPSARDALGSKYAAAHEVLLATVDETGDATLDALVRAIPDHPAPITAILDLVDGGSLSLDLASPFDAGCRVWRSVAPRL